MAVTWKEGFLNLAMDEELKGETYRVFFVILSQMDQEYFSSAVPTAIARILSISRQAASRAVVRLVERGIIQRRFLSDKLIGFDILVFGKTSLPPE